MKTIHQLAKLARRIPRARALCMAKLMHGPKSDGSAYLTPAQAGFYKAKIAALGQAAKLLAFELTRRNIGRPAKRVATPHLLRARRAMLSLHLATASL